MSSGKHLLSLSSDSPSPHSPNSDNCQPSSSLEYSPVVLEDDPQASFLVKAEKLSVDTNLDVSGEHSASAAKSQDLHSTCLHSWEFPLEHTPPERKKCLVSWGSDSKLQHGCEYTPMSTSSPPPGSPRTDLVVDQVEIPRVYHKSMQSDDGREANYRSIYINDPSMTNDKYRFRGNEIRTSRYTLINFLPKNLFIQFHRVAYLYFLGIAALNQLPPLAVFGRTASLFPLLFVLLVTAIKDGYEDWRRHRSDLYENNRKVLVLQSGKFQNKKWKDIRAGEVVKVSVEDSIPCDMVLLRTSDPSGIAYIQTMNLDGESNLKTRYARNETISMDFEGGEISGVIRCEQPNRNIYEFMAYMELDGQRYSLSQSNIILRGCQLKNTEYAIGVVIYAGQETKAMMNSAASPSKRSRLETYMNRETIWLSIFLIVMCGVVALGMALWLKRHDRELDRLPYYKKSYSVTGMRPAKLYKYYGIPMETLFSFLSCVIVFQIMIPISLYITMELVRLGQSFFMVKDKHMYYKPTDTWFQCRSLNINEDLGQIRYVFSDKTGTLTENKMEFKKASVYGKNCGTFLAAPSTSQDKDIAASSSGKEKLKLKSDITLDSELMAMLHKDLTKEDRIAAHKFFLALAACNTVIPIHASSACTGSIDDDVNAIDYQGESPDEIALVTAASAYGYTLCERTSGHIVINVNGEKLRLDVLGMHEFDSVRKRMSVVIKLPNGEIKVLVKGADTSVFNILNEDPEKDEHLKQMTESHLNEYSAEGLRTLVVAGKDLTGGELDEWQHTYEGASTSLTDRSSKLRQSADFIECNLNLLGATGIEDKLQEGVPETIESLREAGIKVWVLTGDKQDTAISIGLSCKLLTSNMQRIIVNGNSENECRKLLSDAKLKYGVNSTNARTENSKSRDNTETDYHEIPADMNLNDLSHSQVRKEEGSGSTTKPTLALIIDGNSLVYILEKDLESELFDLAIVCRVVLCCRVAPLQKAGIVDLIKCRTEDLTLAIGDGANDVSMIQMADVGVGICGQEGRQAVMASDFAMGQFRFLKRLLLVHGHWNYQRLAYLVLYNFYRNAVFVLMLFWYMLFTAFSTTNAITDWSSVFYSLIYTSVPTIIVGVLDKDLSHKTLFQVPKLYAAGHRNESYNLQLFWITMIDTLWQSLVLFFVPFLTFRVSTIDIYSVGSLWTIAVVILVNLHLAMDIKRWVLLTHCSIWGSILVTYICLVILDSIPDFPNFGTIYHLATWPAYWLCILLIIVLALLPRLIFKALSQTFRPSDLQIAREAEILRKRRGYVWSKPSQGSMHVRD
ncbi:hypothetical protein DCAR_0415448 [Daucus carota subsp. sativus]|uniref:Phospholipid-transporting ATPase n=1 Tax=Daucus carota subsp. sativus TaxID=79200 RepID=A0AAF0WUM5_DAUCS|nr:hypothetical protein DCAR_0415448 [Daucus carota subsp. sativus]